MRYMTQKKWFLIWAVCVPLVLIGYFLAWRPLFPNTIGMNVLFGCWASVLGIICLMIYCKISDDISQQQAEETEQPEQQVEGTG